MSHYIVTTRQYRNDIPRDDRRPFVVMCQGMVAQDDVIVSRHDTVEKARRAAIRRNKMGA